MLKHAIVVGALCYLVTAEPPVQSAKSNIIGSSEHTSFSFIRPGLTQTSFAFSGPSSHQYFASSIGNPHLAQKVLPNLAHALAQRNPNLGYYPLGTIANGYEAVSQNPTLAASATGPLTYQTNAIDPAIALAYTQQLQQPQQAYLHTYQPNTISQLQLAQLLALRQAQSQFAQAQQGQLQAVQSEQVPEQIQLQRQEQQPERQQNLLGIAYSSAPSVAHVKVSGNGYKFNF